MGNSIYWIIALVVLQALIGALAKKAQKDQQARSKPGGPAAPERASPTSSRDLPRTPARAPQPAIERNVGVEPQGSDSPDQIFARPVEPTRAPTPPQQKVVPVAKKTPPATPPKKIPKSPRPPTGGAPTSPRQVVRGGTATPGPGSMRGAITRDRLGDPKRRFGLGNGTRGTVRSTGKPAVMPSAAPAVPAKPAPAVGHLQRANAGLTAGRPGLSADGQRIASGAGSAGIAAPRAADVRALFRDPRRFRDAFVVGELLAPPRSLRGS